MQWWTRRFNQKLAAALGGVVLLCLIASGFSGFSFLLLPSGVLFWLYLVSLALLIETALLWRRGVYPELPFGPETWRGKFATFALLGFVVVFTLLREGVFAPDLEYNFDWYTNTSHYNYNTNTNSS